MEWLKTLLMVVQIISAIGVIGLVLVQQGKGADMGAAFGSGASGSIFGATGSSNFLSRTTGVLATVFFLSTLMISYVGTKHENDAGVLSKPTSISVPDQPNKNDPAKVTKEVDPKVGSSVPK
jgi:preprotein translocase subunit SecG